MYVGRIVAIGRTTDDKLAALYRVSSRSFPNRQAKIIGNAVSIVPREGFEKDIFSNPYISYNCLRWAGRYAVVTNGSHTDPIAEKLQAGMNMRDAMIAVMHGMDFEHDSLNTPRIAAIVDSQSRKGALGIVRADALLVEEIGLERGELRYIATYEHNHPDARFGETGFRVQTSDEACAYILGRGVFAELERPIVAACALETGGAYSVSFQDAKRTE